jgi:hypothetical protein
MELKKEDKRKLLIVFTFIALGIVLLLIKRKSKPQESGFVAPRGFFPGGGTTTPTTPTPPMDIPDGRGAGGGGGTVMDIPPTDIPPVTPMPPTPPNPSYPYPSYPVLPYYPAPVYYNPFPRTYNVINYSQNQNMNKGQYIDYLQKQINSLEFEYDDALSSLMFGRAYKISKVINSLKDKLRIQLGY